jgi:hypothetical protein
MTLAELRLLATLVKCIPPNNIHNVNGLVPARLRTVVREGGQQDHRKCTTSPGTKAITRARHARPVAFCGLYDCSCRKFKSGLRSPQVRWSACVRVLPLHPATACANSATPAQMTKLSCNLAPMLAGMVLALELTPAAQYIMYWQTVVCTSPRTKPGSLHWLRLPSAARGQLCVGVCVLSRVS